MAFRYFFYLVLLDTYECYLLYHLNHPQHTKNFKQVYSSQFNITSFYSPFSFVLLLFYYCSLLYHILFSMLNQRSALGYLFLLQASLFFSLSFLLSFIILRVDHHFFEFRSKLNYFVDLFQ